MRGKVYLTKPKQYALTCTQGSSWVNNLMVVKALPNGLAFCRYGLSVSHHVGKAVTRNRVKRLFREILRLLPLTPGWDIVFIARPAAATTNYATLEKSINGLLAKARLLRPLENTFPSASGVARNSGENSAPAKGLFWQFN